MEYVITAEYPRNGRCLVAVCGKNLEKAKEILNKMKTNPDDNDLRLIKEGKDLMIEEVEDKDCWWNGNLD